MLDILHEFTLRGGKRIRPALCYYAYQCFRADRLDAVLQASLACELLETSLLIHDDIMDEASTRRGGMTVHRIYEQVALGKGLSFGQARRYGESMAMLVGTVASQLGLQVLQECNFPVEVRDQAAQLYREVLIDEQYGQAMDMQPRQAGEYNGAYALELARNKTARYTTELPLMLGCTLAERRDMLPAFQEIGRDIGIAFQIKDDILGVFGREEVTGKSVSDDIREGKKTLLVSCTWEDLSPADRAVLARTVGNANASDEDVAEVRKLMRVSGALAKAEAEVVRLLNAARAQLDSLGLRSEGREFIREIIDFVRTREY